MNLYLYFGIVGILSIAVWLAALLTALNYFRQPRRLGYFSRALGLAVIGWLLAVWNSHNVGLIEIDRTQELKAAYEQQRRIRIEDGGIGYDLSADARFTEDGAHDALDLAGIKSDDKKNIYERAVKTDSWAERRAKRSRAKKLGTNDFDAMLKDTVIVGDGRQAVYRVRKKLPASDVVRANRLDVTNRWMAISVVYLCLFLLVWEYMRWFNRTVGFYLPLPIAGRLLDALFPKRHSTVFSEKDDAWDRRFLEDIVAKGETFIYAGPRDPLPVATVSRIAVPIRRVWEATSARFHLQRWLRFLPSWPAAVERWSLPKLVYASSQAAIHESFLFESAWFGRYAFSLRNVDCAAIIPALIDFMRQRLQTRARANRTVHVVLRDDNHTDEGMMRQLAFMAGEINFKMVWLSPQNQVQRLAGLVEEVCPDQAGTAYRPTFMAVITRWFHALGTAVSVWMMKLHAARLVHRKIRLEQVEARKRAKAEAIAAAKARAAADAEAKRKAQAIAEAQAQVKLKAASISPKVTQVLVPPSPAVQPVTRPKVKETPKIEEIPKVKPTPKVSVTPEVPGDSIPKKVPSVSVAAAGDSSALHAKPTIAPLPAPMAAAPSEVKATLPKAQEPAAQAIQPVTLAVPHKAISIVKVPEAKVQDQSRPVIKKVIKVPKIAEPLPKPSMPPPAAPLPQPAAPKPLEKPATQIPLDKDSIDVLYTEGIMKFYCRHCSQKLSAPIQWGGTQINCPSCNVLLTIPVVPLQQDTGAHG